MPPSEEVENTEAPTQLLKQPITARCITCEFCNKNMQMKTYKYSHKKQCEAKHAPPPPPPPPTPEPKKRPKRESKPKEAKEAKEATVKESQTQDKTQFSGVVSFNDFPPIDPFVAMREQRIMARQTRVKSLISQAI
jgi:hypothetical protein